MTFAPSVTDQEVEVTISNDGVYELLEEFIGQISLPSDSEGVVLGANQATVAISDDDGEWCLMMSYPYQYNNITYDNYARICKNKHSYLSAPITWIKIVRFHN